MDPLKLCWPPSQSLGATTMLANDAACSFAVSASVYEEVLVETQ